CDESIAAPGFRYAACCRMYTDGRLPQWLPTLLHRYHSGPSFPVRSTTLEMFMRDAQYWIDRYELVEHPEGGYFHETHRSVEKIPSGALPSRYGGERRMSTAIYYLVKGERPALLHRLKSEEIWHFYAGSPVTVYI